MTEQIDGANMIRTLALVLAVIVAFAVPAVASDFGTREEAVAMVKRVQDKFSKDGPEAAFKAVTDQSTKEFHDRDLYPFIYDLSGLNVAHGARPVLVGKNLISLKDQDGKYLIKEMIAIATTSGSGWIDYKWPHPITNKIEDKSSYIEKLGDYFVGVGVYRF
jgi:signal transduction histidine kinase